MLKIFRFITSLILVVASLSLLLSSVANAGYHDSFSDDSSDWASDTSIEQTANHVILHNPPLRTIDGISIVLTILRFIPYVDGVVSRIRYYVSGDDKTNIHRPYLDHYTCESEEYGINLCVKEIEKSILNIDSDPPLCKQKKSVSYQLSENGHAIANNVVSCCVDSIETEHAILFCETLGQKNDIDHPGVQYRFQIYFDITRGLEHKSTIAVDDRNRRSPYSWHTPILDILECNKSLRLDDATVQLCAREMDASIIENGEYACEKTGGMKYQLAKKSTRMLNNFVECCVEKTSPHTVLLCDNIGDGANAQYRFWLISKEN